jgi:hypothetical protein
MWAAGIGNSQASFGQPIRRALVLYLFSLEAIWICEIVATANQKKVFTAEARRTSEANLGRETEKSQVSPDKGERGGT